MLGSGVYLAVVVFFCGVGLVRVRGQRFIVRQVEEGTHEGSFSGVIRHTDFKIGPSTIHGRGVFTTKPYAEGEWVGVQWYSTKHKTVFDPRHCNFDSAQRDGMSDKQLGLCPWRATNHQCQGAAFSLCTCPWHSGNLFIAMALRHVDPGTEITFNFRSVEQFVDTGFIPDGDCAGPEWRTPAPQCPDCTHHKPINWHDHAVEL